MESGEDANSDDNNEVDQEPMNVRAQEGTSGRNSPGSTSTSVSTDTSVNDPTPSVSNTSVLRPTGTVNANNWKSANAFMNYVQDFRQNLRQANKVVKQSTVCQLAGQQWRVMPDDEKQVYIDGALAIKRNQSRNEEERKKSNKRARPRSKVRDKKSASSNKRAKVVKK